MCIIVAKPSGVAIPVTETFNNCADSNRDGIGFSYNLTGQRPRIVKGFKDVKKLERALEACRVTPEHNLIVHFRHATHGVIDEGNCHPFPLTGNYEDMRIPNCSCDCALAHNGVFSAMPAHEKYSDTMKFIGEVLAAPEVIHNLEKPSIKELLRGYLGFSSRLAFMRPEGITVLGNFEVDEGIYYSNNQYKKYTYVNSWDTNVKGQRWCYIHKAYDDCTWCPDHKQYDTCEFELLQFQEEGNEETAGEKWRKRFEESIISNPPLLTSSTKCTLCMGVEKVKYHDTEECFMCEECAEYFKVQ